eukprot:189001-Pyramimonas_sp.AAC.1
MAKCCARGCWLTCRGCAVGGQLPRSLSWATAMVLCAYLSRRGRGSPTRALGRVLQRRRRAGSNRRRAPTRTRGRPVAAPRWRS